MQSRLMAVALSAGILLLSSGAASAESLMEWAVTLTRTKGVQQVTNKKYLEECGACHFAYQPGLLPAKTWEKLLTDKALSEHFGDNAELDKDTLQIIHDYTIENAADTSFYKTARKISLAAQQGDLPLRITETRYIRRKHHELKDEMVKGNKDVKSLSNCNACHIQADKGVYDDSTVSIPNFPDF